MSQHLDVSSSSLWNFEQQLQNFKQQVTTSSPHHHHTFTTTPGTLMKIAGTLIEIAGTLIEIGGTLIEILTILRYTNFKILS